MDNQEHELFGVLQTLATRLPEKGRTHVIQFVSPSGGEGTTTVALQFARLLSLKFRRSVCFVTVGTCPEAAREGGDQDETPVSLAEEDAGVTVQRLVNTDVYVVWLSTRDGIEAVSERLPKLCQHLASRFDTFIVDSPPISRAPEALLIAQYAGSVVLVIEAEETTQSTADAACALIERAGGHLMGVVLNKRRFRVPGFLAELVGGEKYRGQSTVSPLRLLLTVSSVILLSAAIFIFAIDVAVLITEQRPEGVAFLTLLKEAQMITTGDILDLLGVSFGEEETAIDGAGVEASPMPGFLQFLISVPGALTAYVLGTAAYFGRWFTPEAKPE
ncbi:MAG: hypothetical protein ACFB6S_11050 [Geminicoccaceae bacterium]